MSLAKAIKRSYRFFIPPGLFRPREFIRRWHETLGFYFVGLITGMYFYARPGDMNRIFVLSITGCVILGILKWWAGVLLE